MGDFNVPLTDWSLAANTSASRILLNAISLHGLHQINDVRNYRGVLLDLIFTTFEDTCVVRDPDPIIPEEAHHPALTFQISYLKDQHFSAAAVPNTRKCKLEKVFHELLTADIEQLISDCQVDKAFDNLCSTIGESVLRNSPRKKIGTSRFPVWFSHELINLIIHKKTLHKRYKMAFEPSVYNQFSAVRSQCKDLARRCYNDYTNHIQEVIPSNPRAFWSFLKKTNRNLNSPSTVSLDGIESNDDKCAANMFADFFSSVFTSTTNPPNCTPTQLPHQLSSCSFNVTEVRRVIQNLDISKGCGPDFIPPSVVKFCCPILEEPLTYLFNRSISSGIFPECFKRSFIIPIHKKGSSSDVRNYRPIAILSVLAKVFERLIFSRISHIIRYQLSPNQHGFVSGRSTATNLLVFQTDVIDAFNERKQLDAVELDFSKAFDQVSHGHLLLKMNGLGFSGSILEWFTSYLSGRKLQVRYNSALSYEFTATSGVPQGSILGPLLFNVFVNDITINLKCKYLLFADDLKLYYPITSVLDFDMLQESLELIESWCLRNCMALNLDKCICITFSRIASPVIFPYTLGDKRLGRASEVKDLGVVVSSTLSWDLQVQAACNRATRSLGLIYRMRKDISNILALKVLYCSLVRPHLEYCSVVWSPHQGYLKDDIESVQRRFLRLVGLQLGYRFSEVPLDYVAQLLDLPSLESRRFQQDILFLYRLINYQLDCPDLLSRIAFRVPSGTRSQDLFARPTVSTNYAKNGSLLRIQLHGNSLPNDLDFFGDDFLGFKRKLRRHCLNN